jgi:hypothetical protein
MQIELGFSSSSCCRMLCGCFDGPRKPILCPRWGGLGIYEPVRHCLRDKAKEVWPQVRPPARENRKRIRWNTIRRGFFGPRTTQMVADCSSQQNSQCRTGS